MVQGDPAQPQKIACTETINERMKVEEKRQYLYKNKNYSTIIEPGFIKDENKKSNLVYRSTKRGTDLVGSLIGLILFLPIIILVAVLIKLGSSGPILFCQTRIGQNRRRNNNGQSISYERRQRDLKGRPFVIYKFRTMKNGVNKYANSPSEHSDFRLTRVGKMLRSMCLDEIPQLINVFKGDMSIVGPRPEMPFIVETYGPLESIRLIVKPGLTGLWQIYASRAQNIHENLQYDLDYLKHRSFMLDIKIMIKTVGYMFRSKNI